MLTIHLTAAMRVIINLIILISWSSVTIYGDNKYQPDNSKKIINVKFEGESIYKILQFIAVEYKVRIGLEQSFKNNDASGISIQCFNCPLNVFLDKLMEKSKVYQWKSYGDTVNVYPKDKERYILEVKVAKFEITQSTIEEIKSKIINIPEWKTFLEANHITPEYSMIYGDFSREKKKFTVQLENTTIRAILNVLATLNGRRMWVAFLTQDNLLEINI